MCVQVFNPLAPSYISSSVSSTFKNHKNSMLCLWTTHLQGHTWHASFNRILEVPDTRNSAN